MENIIKNLKSIANMPDFQDQYPNILLECPPGCNDELFISQYVDIVKDANILKSSHFCPALCLEYPGYGDSKDFNRFISSPQIIANNHFLNRYYGVMVVYFNNFEGASLQDINFHKLLMFVKENHENMRFVFVISKNCSFLEEMLSMINGCALFEHIELIAPSLKESSEYLCSELEDQKISLTEDAFRDLVMYVELISEKKEYDHYQSMHKLVCNIKRELLLKEGNVGSVVTKNMFDDMKERVNPIVEYSRKIGFSL